MTDSVNTRTLVTGVTYGVANQILQIASVEKASRVAGWQ